MNCRSCWRAGAALLWFCLATGAGADPQSAKDLIGIWAHSEADCQTKLSGQLDRGDLSRPEQTPYELVGFCKSGMELLYQPVYCATQEIEAVRGGYRWSGTCRVKDYDPRRLQFILKSNGSNAISFDERDFDGSDFSIDGSYVRCSLTYKCANE